MTSLDAALDVASFGWPLFPCEHRQGQHAKAPLVPGPDKDDTGKPIERTGGLWRASTDPAQIRAWWRSRPRALIGVPMGRRSGVFVIDLDPMPKKGEAEPIEATLARLVEAVGELPFGPVSETQSGGRHIWFRCPDDGEIPKNSAKRLRNIDWRGDGGYVIVPPSTMDDGRAYRWIVSPAEAEFPAAPARLLDLMFRRGEFAPAKAIESVQAVTPARDPFQRRAPADDAGEKAVRAYARGALDRAAGDVARAPPGTRGHTLNAAAFGLKGFVEAGALSEREVVAALQDAADVSGLTAEDGAQERDSKIRRGLSAIGGVDQRGTLERIRREAEDRAARRSSRPPPPGSASDYGYDGPAAQPAPPEDNGPAPDDGLDTVETLHTPKGGAPPVDPEVLARCAALDQSDTDNATRLVEHFGQDLAVLAQEGVDGGDWLTWTGTHWDLAGGAAGARLLAQKVGPLIKLEADLLAATPKEQALLDEADDAAAELDKLRALPRDQVGDEQRRRMATLAAAVENGDLLRKVIRTRKKGRRDFGVSSKNAERIEKMLRCAAPRLRRPPETFNPGRLVVAAPNATLRFVREPDPECPDPEAHRFRSRVDVTMGHRREDWITACVPVRWEGPNAPAPNFRAFMDEMMPDAAKRRTVQQYSGLGLTGVPLQYLMFHYGTGANGKSVFLETLTRAFGPGLAVSLPRESIVGMGDRGQGSASPDIVRLYGKRMVRIAELKADAPLQEDLVKRLTGGESFAARALFKGFFEFQNVAKPHMSGNGFPTIDGTDNGIKRRLLVVHWDQVVPEDKRRDLEDMVAGFIAKEGPGILAWLVEGVLDWLANGLVVAESVRASSKAYFDEMDPIGEFFAACVLVAPGERVRGQAFYQAYERWSHANAKKPRSLAKFGRTAGMHFRKSEVNGIQTYHDLRLHNVPMPESSGPAALSEAEYGGG